MLSDAGVSANTTIAPHSSAIRLNESDNEFSPFRMTTPRIGTI